MMDKYLFLYLFVAEKETMFTFCKAINQVLSSCHLFILQI